MVQSGHCTGMKIQSYRQIPLHILAPISAQLAYFRLGSKDSWAEMAGQTVQRDLVVTLDFHSVWYRDYLVQDIEQSVGV